MDALLREFGLPLTLIVVYSGVIAFLFMRLQRANDDYRALQEKRLEEAIEYRDTLSKPLNEQIELGKKTYELLLRFNERGK